MGYFQIIKKDPKAIAFGFLHTFFAGLGQTHFISIFNPLIMAGFALNHSQYGTLYSIITLMSGIIMIFIGPLIDRYDIRYFCLLIALGLITGLVQIFMTKTLLLLGLGLFGLRFFGQGLSSTVSSITIARYFTKNRGKALSLSQIGFPFYEILITPFFAFLLNFFLFQNLLFVLIFTVLMVYLPLSLWLTSTLPSEFNKIDKKKEHSANRSKEQGLFEKSWTRREVFGHKTIYFLLGQTLMPAFALTGIFFHQVAISQVKGWSPGLMASGFIFFGLGRVINTFATGPLVDKYKATTLFPFHHIPMCLGFFIMAQNHQQWVPSVCFLLFGLTVGSGGPIKAALWVEIYGIQHLGALKSLFATFMIFSTAIAPALFGHLIEKEYEISHLFHGLSLFSLFVSLLSFMGLKKHLSMH